MDQMKPVNGSLVLMKSVSEYKAKDGFAIYLVYVQCPKYSGGKRNYHIKDIAHVEDGCIYGKDNKIISFASPLQMSKITKQRYDKTIALFDQKDEWNVSELVAETGFTQPTVKGHMDKAVKAGVVEKNGKKKVFYTGDNGRRTAVWVQYYKKAIKE